MALIEGDENDNVLTGTDAADTIRGYGGNDQIDGGGGDDLIFGGAGADVMSGGAGDDDYWYVDAEDQIIEAVGGGRDSVIVSRSFTLAPGQEIESLQLYDPNSPGVPIVLTGNEFANTITGMNGSAEIFGGGGDDILDGGDGLHGFPPGPARLHGGTGNDIFVVRQQSDQIHEEAGEGIDTVRSSASIYLYANVENLVLTPQFGALYGVGNELDNAITGNESANLLIGGAGNDAIRGGDGNDSLFGETGNDQLFGDAGIDYLVGGTGNDMLDGGGDADALYGEDGDDTLAGGDGFVTDILVGGSGNDVLRGDSGLADYDRMDGGSGNDSYYVDTGDDLTFEAADGGTDTVYANVAGANNGVYLYAHVENLVLLGTTAFGVGNELANMLTGSASGNWLLGGAGDDTLNGKGGGDVLFGEGGADIFVFDHGTGGDVIGDFLAGTDKIDLRDFGFGSFAQVQSVMVENGGTTAIDLVNGDFIVINGVTNAALQAGDFILSGSAAAARAAPDAGHGAVAVHDLVHDLGLPGLHLAIHGDAWGDWALP